MKKYVAHVLFILLLIPSLSFAGSFQLFKERTLGIRDVSVAMSTNEKGAIGGVSYDAVTDRQRCFHISEKNRKTYIDIGFQCEFADLNESDVITGHVRDPNMPYRGFVLRDGVVTFLPGEDVQPYAINNAGQVVGRMGWNGFVWENGAMREIDYAIDNNDVGQILVLNAVINSDGSTVYFDFHPMSMNNLGQVVGYQDTSDGRKVVVWKDGVKEILNANFMPIKISDNGWIVGNRGNTPILWDGEKEIALTNSEAEVFSINNYGKMVGYRLDHSHTETRAVEWMPSRTK